MSKEGECRVCSYEIGVLIWPALFDDDPSGLHANHKGEVSGDCNQDRARAGKRREAIMVSRAQILKRGDPFLSRL